MPSNIEIQLVYEPLRRPTVIGRSSDKYLIDIVCETLIMEARKTAEQMEGIDDHLALEERMDAERLQQVLALLLPERQREDSEP